MKTMEQVAKKLLGKKVPFTYSECGIEIRPCVFKMTVFATASYYVGTKRLVFMDGNFNEVPIAKVIEHT